jgi:hypothetical protein
VQPAANAATEEPNLNVPSPNANLTDHDYCKFRKKRGRRKRPVDGNGNDRNVDGNGNDRNASENKVRSALSTIRSLMLLSEWLKTCTTIYQNLTTS